VALSINGTAWMLLHELDKFDAEHQLAEECIAFSPLAVAATLGAVAAGVTHEHEGLDEMSELMQLPLNCLECVDDLARTVQEVMGRADNRALFWMPMSLWLPTQLRPQFVEFCADTLGVGAGGRPWRTVVVQLILSVRCCVVQLRVVSAELPSPL